MTRSVLADTLVRPAWLTYPLYKQTLGPEVADLCELAGFAPDPEQRLGLDLIFALRPDGRSAALEIGVVCSRQNLKTGLFKMAALGWLFITDQRLVTWSAHEFSVAQEAFRDLKELIEGCPSLARQLKPDRKNGISESNGEEGIELVGDRRLRFKARTNTGGRGLSGDKIVLDEAFALKPSHMGALFPTLSARPDPQVLYGSSAGLMGSAVLRAVRDRGRTGGDPRLAYLEWADDLGGNCAIAGCDHNVARPGCRLDDRRRWRRSNPALGRRITEEYVEAERRAIPAAEFARERLGWWDEPVDTRETFLEDWLSCIDANSRAEGRPVFAVDCAPNSRSAAIVAATQRPDGKTHLEVVEHRSGVRWVAQRVAELAKQLPVEWLLDPGGPAGVLLAPLAEVGIDPRKLTFRDLGRACEGLSVAVADRQVAHLGDPIITAAISGAGRRDIGDGMWAWSRRRSDADIAPLVAASIAWWGLATAEQPKPAPASPVGLDAGPAASPGDSMLARGF